MAVAVAVSPRAVSVTSPPPTVGARLLLFHQEWVTITENRFVLEIVRIGASLVFHVQPPLSAGFIPFSLPREGSPKRDALFAEIRALVTKGAVVPLPQTAGPGFYCNLFLVAKVTGGFRPVINLKSLNRFLHNPRFKMETSRSIIKAVSPGEWSVSIDLTDAYLHVPIRPEHQRYLRFAVSQTEAYQFRALPFGLSSAPRIFTMVLREVAQYLHHRGIKFHFYLDDWLIRHHDPVVLQEQLQVVLRLAARLGWLVNKEKSDLVPSRQFTYLGLDFDTQSAVVRPSLRRVERLEGCVRLFRRRPCQPARAILRLLGHMVSLSDYTHMGRLHTRPLQLCLLGQWRPHRDSLEAPILLDEAALSDLSWWLSRTNTRSGVPLRPPKPSVTLMTDASLSGWGASLTIGDGRLQVAGGWPPSYSGRSINSLELEAVLLAIHEFAGHLSQTVVMVLSDNTTTVSYLAKQGGTHSALLCGLAWQIFQLAESLSLQIQVRHIPGRQNVLADSLSRHSPVQTEWALDQSVFQAVVAHFGLSPVIDLLATPLNAKLPVFLCPFPDPAAFGVDALSVPWEGFRVAYAYPPTALMRDVLGKLKGLDMILILIAPWWPNQSWFPDLLELSIDHPVELPVTRNLLTQPVGGRIVHHYRPQVLALTAWCLCGVPSGAKVSQQQQRSASAVRPDARPRPSTMSAGRSGSTGVGNEVWIHRIPLFPQ